MLRAQTRAWDSSFGSQRGPKGADRSGQDGSNLAVESDGLGAMEIQQVTYSLDSLSLGG